MPVLRNKMFLIGLGSGLIAGAIMLQLMWKVDEMESKTNRTSMTDFTVEQVKKEAERLSMTVISKDQQVYTSQQIDEIKRMAAEEEKTRQAKAAPTPAPTTQSPVTKEATKEKIVRTVVIPDRSDATAVAALLVQAQIISEPTKLIAMLQEQKLTSRIYYGFYSFENSPEVAEVVKKITTLP